MAFYTPDWQKQNFVDNHPLDQKTMPRPENLDKMIKMAEKLSSGFAYVRVDFYRLYDGTIYFGEMTFTPASGLCNWNDEKYNVYFGKMIELPKLAYNIDTGEYYKLPKTPLWKKALKNINIDFKKIKYKNGKKVSRYFGGIIKKVKNQKSKKIYLFGVQIYHHKR
jgi:hypothetical protein